MDTKDEISVTNTKVNFGNRCQLVKQYRRDLHGAGNQLCCRPVQSQSIFKSNQHTKVNSKSLLWAGKHILHPFYLYSIFYPHTGGVANLQHSEKKQQSIEDRSLQVLHSLFLASQPLTLVGVKQASFRDDLLLPLFLGKKTNQRKLTHFVVLVFVKNKLFLILFSAEHHSFQQPLCISDKQCVGQATNSSF